jgi:hypothetical protein
MATTIAEIREGIAANLATLEGIQVSAYMLASPTPPAAHVIPRSILYDRTFRGMVEVTLTVQVFVSLGLDQGAQMALDERLLGTTSVKAALEVDKTLGGTVNDLWCSEMESYDVVSIPDRGQMLSATWSVTVRT